MVKSIKGDIEVMSVDEKRFKDYKKQFEEANRSFEMQIELNKVLINYLEDKIKKCT
jgi:hypothetical protein